MIDCKDTINFKRAIFSLEQTERLLTSDVFKKRKKTKLEENKNNILSGVNAFRKERSKTTGKSSCGIFRDSARSNN